MGGKEALPDKVKPLLVGLERMYQGPGPFLYTSEAEGPMLGDLAVCNVVTSPFPGLAALGVDMSPYPKLQACVAACELPASGSSTGPSPPTGGVLSLKVIAAYNLKNTDSGLMGDVSDPFVNASIGAELKHTATINDNLNPVWDSEPFNFLADVGHPT